MYTLNAATKVKAGAALLLLFLLRTNAFAQSCCCTGAGANYAILPNMDKHVVGIRYSYGSYNTTTYTMTGHQHTPGMDMSTMGPGIPTVENIHTIDAFARFNLPKRFQVSAFVPVNLITQKTTAGIKRTAGLGDISFLVQYSVFNPLKCKGKESKHQLRLGAGIKLPTGKFNMNDDGLFLTDLQLGTGSVDFLFNAIYTYRFRQFGLNLLASYKKNLMNSKHFRFGDKMKGGANVFYIFKLPKKVSLMPLLGLNYNYSFYNVYEKTTLTYTGGQYLASDIGLDVYYKQFAVSATVSPVLMNIKNWTGAPSPTVLFETGLYYNFSMNFKSKKTDKNEKPELL